MFYLLDAVASGSNHLSLQENGSAPAVATTATGWEIGTVTIAHSARQAAGVERVASDFGSAAQPATGDPDNSLGDCWRSDLYVSKSFSAGNWELKLALISVTNGWISGDNHQSTIQFRLLKSANADGSSATLLTGALGGGGRIQTNATLNLLTSVQQVVNLVFNPGAITLTNEYLFLQIALLKNEATTTPTDRDVHIRVGPDSTLSEPGAIPPINASITATLPNLTGTLSATFAPLRTASIAATLPNVAMSISGDTSIPEYTGTLVADLPNVAMTLSGITSVPEFSGSIVATLPNVALVITATSDVPEFNATLIADLPNVVFIASAFVGNPTNNATIEVELPNITLVLLGNSVVPEYTADIAATLPNVEVSITATRTLPQFNVTFAATLPNVQVTISGDVSFPLFFIDVICTCPEENNLEFEVTERDILIQAQEIHCGETFRASGGLNVVINTEFNAIIDAVLPNVSMSLSADFHVPVAYNQTQAGNYSDPATWGGVGPPRLIGGDTATQNFNLTIDVDAVIGTSPNDTTTIVLKRDGGVLTVAENVTFEIRGKWEEAFTFANDYTLILNEGSHIRINPALSGGSPEYIWYNTFNSLQSVATEENPATISAPDGYKWKWENTTVAPKLDVQHLRLLNLADSTITLSPSITQIRFEHVRIENQGNTFSLLSGLPPIDALIRHIKVTGSYHPTLTGEWNGITLWDIHDTAVGETWQINFGDTGARGIVAHHIMVKGGYVAVGGGTTARFKQFTNSFVRSLSDQLKFYDTDLDQNFFYGYAPGPNYHQLSLAAITRKPECKRCFFELDVGDETLDNGDWIFPLDEFGFGMDVHHNIVTHNTRAGSVGTTMSVTPYFSQPLRRVKFWNNTLPCDWSVGVAGCIHLGEGGSSEVDIIEWWKNNLCYSNGTNPGYMVMRLDGSTTSGILQAAGANGNATVGLLVGNNGRSYHDAKAPIFIKSLWNNDDADGTNAATAGVDNIRLVDVPPNFRGINRDLKSWGAMKGFGIVPEDIMDQLFEDTSLIDELHAWCVEGRTPQNILYQNAGVEGITPGAVEYAPAP